MHTPLAIRFSWRLEYTQVRSHNVQLIGSKPPLPIPVSGSYVGEPGYYQPVRGATMYNYRLTELNQMVEPQAQLFETLGSESEDEGAL